MNIPTEKNKNSNILDKQSMLILDSLMNKKISLKILHQNFRNNKALILELLKLDYEEDIYEFIGMELKKDEEVFLECVNRGDRLYYIPHTLVRNKDLMLKTLAKTDIYDYIHREVPYDKNGNTTNIAYEYDEDIIKCYIKTYPKNLKRLNKKMINFIAKDKEQIKKCLQFEGNFNCLSKKDKLNIDNIECALKQNKNSIYKVPKELLKNKEFVLYIIDKFNIGLNVFHYQLQNDEDVVKLALIKNGYNLPYANRIFRNKIDMILLASKTADDVKELNLEDKFKNNLELMNIFLKKNAKNYSELSITLKKDFSIALDCVERYSGNYQHLPTTFKKNWEFIYQASQSAELTQLINEVPNSQFHQLVKLNTSEEQLKYIHAKALEEKFNREDKDKDKEKINNKEFVIEKPTRKMKV